MRTFTPDRLNPDGSRTVTLQRVCNGCGHVIGDITDAELRAVTGGTTHGYAVLPDVRDECPRCNPRPLVGPVRTVNFYGGPGGSLGCPASVNYDTPRDTLDPRVARCTDHRVACDCREAEHAEIVAELRYELREFRAAFDKVLAGHPTGSSYVEDPENFCQCTGCQIARTAHHYPEGATR